MCSKSEVVVASSYSCIVSVVVWPVLCAEGSVFLLFAVDMATNKTGANIESTSSFGVACFTVVVGHCRFHSSVPFAFSSRVHNSRTLGRCTLCFCSRQLVLERNAARTQEQHFDQGEMVDGRAATLGHRKITVKCRDTFCSMNVISRSMWKF